MTTSSTGNGVTPLPLAGVRVLEFCHTIMGPSGGLLLADLGADVIKIEPSPEGDRTRRLPGFASGFFVTFNRNKRSFAVNMKTPEGRDLIHRLAARSDVVMENFAPGTMQRLGCDYDTLSAINPRLIFCELKGFLSGPYEHRPALDEVVQFMTGLAYMTGPPGQPLRAGSSVVDIVGGMFAVIAIQAALRDRDRTGRGQLVRSSLYESSAFLVAQHMAGEAMTGKAPPPMPARQGAWAVYEPFDTSDNEQVFIGITSDNHWQRFCERFGFEHMLNDPKYLRNEDRVEQRDTLLPMVAKVAKQYTKSALVQILDEISIPFSPVAKPSDLFDDPQLKAHGRMLDIELPSGERSALPRIPIEIGEHDMGLRMQAPKAGEHTREVLEALDLSDQQIADLLERQIVSASS